MLDLPVAHAAAVTQVGIGEREYAIAVYRPRVKPGRLHLNVRNLGEDVHDLVVKRNGKRIAGLSTVIKPGSTATLALTLRTTGTYQLICTIADHAARGMRATLRVAK